MSEKNFDIRIDQISVAGLDDVDPELLRTSIEEALAQRISEQGNLDHERSRSHVEQIDGGEVPAAQAGDPQTRAAGGQIARSIHSAINP